MMTTAINVPLGRDIVKKIKKKKTKRLAAYNRCLEEGYVPDLLKVHRKPIT